MNLNPSSKTNQFSRDPNANPQRYQRFSANTKICISKPGAHPAVSRALEAQVRGALIQLVDLYTQILNNRN